MTNDGGRPPKPTHLKVLHGDRDDRVNDAEPVPSEGEIVPPVDLTKEGREVWDRLAPDRIAKGVLTAWDVDAFAEFCESLVILRRKRRAASRGKAEQGKASPMNEWKLAVQVVTSLGGRFGWTPSDRAKLEVDRGQEQSDDLLSGSG